MGLIVIDASVMIAALDGQDALHAAAATMLQDHIGETLVLPASVFAEIMVGAHRAGRADPTRNGLHRAEVRVEPLTEEMADAAARLHARFPSMRLADALILGTAEVLGADRILTGDHRWTAWSDRVILAERPALRTAWLTFRARYQPRWYGPRSVGDPAAGTRPSTTRPGRVTLRMRRHGRQMPLQTRHLASTS